MQNNIVKIPFLLVYWIFLLKCFNIYLEKLENRTPSALIVKMGKCEQWPIPNQWKG